MAYKALAGFQLPLFENPPVVKEPEQLLMLEVFSELAKQKKTSNAKYGIDLMPWPRRHALTKAASFHPKHDSGAVLELFYRYSSGDCRPEVFDHFLSMYLRRAEDRPLKLDLFLAHIEKHVAKAQIPTLADVVNGQ